MTMAGFLHQRRGPTGATGATGPAPAGTGYVTVTGGVLDTPSSTIPQLAQGRYPRSKTADEAVSNSTALQNDDHLVWTALPAGTYEVEGFLSLVLVSGVGIKAAMVASGGAVVGSGSFVHLDIQAASALTLVARGTLTAFDGSATVGAAGTVDGAATMRVNGTITLTTGGDLALQWAQHTIGAKTAATISNRSRITLSKVA